MFRVRATLLFLCFILTPIFSWGFDAARTEKYLAQAEQLKLHENIKWIRLGHYEKTLSGYQSSFRGPLFLHEEGHTSPQLEMRETIRAFFTDEYKTRHEFPREPQCQFLARRNWLIKQLNIAAQDILPCEERRIWKQRLGATSVALVFASADMSNPASSFGHTFLKLINPTNAQNKDLIDYGVNYAADANENDFMYAMRGLFGFYGGLFTMLPYHQKIIEYINLEGRDIVEYHLTFNAQETDELINHLLELEKSSAPYLFLSDNCSYQLLKALEVIRPEYNFTDRFTFWVIPIDTIKTVNERSPLIAFTKHKKSLNTDYAESYAKLNYVQRNALNEAVEKLTINDQYELDRTEKSHVYETAMKYMAVKAYRTGEDLDQKKYELAIARAQLGLTEEKRLINPKPFQPELSHDSSAVSLGRGSVRDFSYTSLRIRPAFHDLEQIDIGMVPMSLNNVFNFDFRYYDDNQKFVLDRFTMMHLLNTTPVTQLDKNLSWKVRIEMRDQWLPDLEYAAGYSFDLGWFEGTRLTQLISGRYTKDSSDRHIYQIGPELMLIMRPFTQLGISLDATYYAEYENTPYLRFQTRLNYELKRNFDLQFRATDERDYEMRALYNFIF